MELPSSTQLLVIKMSRPPDPLPLFPQHSALPILNSSFRSLLPKLLIVSNNTLSEVVADTSSKSQPYSMRNSSLFILDQFSQSDLLLNRMTLMFLRAQFQASGTHSSSIASKRLGIRYLFQANCMSRQNFPILSTSLTSWSQSLARLIVNKGIWQWRDKMKKSGLSYGSILWLANFLKLHPASRHCCTKWEQNACCNRPSSYLWILSKFMDCW